MRKSSREFGTEKDEKYWILATLYEASVGLSEEVEALGWKEKADKTAKDSWMIQTTEEQISRLRALLG